MTRPRGSILVAVLLLTSLFVTMALALFYKQKQVQSAGQLEAYAFQARLLAQGGIDDAMTRLSKVPGFPPVTGLSERTFTYAERVFDPELRDDKGQLHEVGEYEVTIDVTNRSPATNLTLMSSYKYPNCIVRIRSRGVALDASQSVVATREIYAEVDTSPKDRSGTADLTRDDPSVGSSYYTNKNYNRIIRWEDGGAP